MAKAGSGVTKKRRATARPGIVPEQRFRRIFSNGMVRDSQGRRFRLSKEALAAGRKLIDKWTLSRVDGLRSLARFSKSKMLKDSHAKLSSEIAKLKQGVTV